MNKFSILLILMTLSIFATDESHQKCLDKDSSNSTIQYCNENEIKYQDKLLNKYYKQAMKNLANDKKEKKNLKLAQRAWIKFRDLDCKSRSYPMRDGTAEYTMHQSCVLELIGDRVRVLRDEY